MKPIRQNTYNLPVRPTRNFSSQKNSQQFTDAKNPVSFSKKINMSMMFSQYHLNQFSLNCYQNIKVVATKRKIPIIRSFMGVASSQIQNITYVSLGLGPNILKQCYDTFAEKQEIQFVFNATHQQNGRKNYPEISKKGKSISNYQKNPVQKLNHFESAKKAIPQSAGKPQLAPYSIGNIGRAKQFEQQMDLNRYFSTKTINNNMFTVEEVGESIQSQAKQSLKGNLNETFNYNQNCFMKNQIGKNLDQITQNYQQKIIVPQLKLNKTDQYKFQIKNNQECHRNKQLNKQNQNDNLFADQQLPMLKPDPCQNQDVIIVPRKSMRQQSNRMSMTGKKQFSDDHRFSFAQKIKKGLISQQAIQSNHWMSFKIVGDQQIQFQKRKLREDCLGLPSNQMNDLSQLSSIVSNNIKQDQQKKDFIEQQQNSIKVEIQNINKCMKKENKIEIVQPVQKIQLQNLANLHENTLNDCIQITQKALTQQNRSQFTVKYNFRFLEKKSGQTEVIRISPLRFRRKQEVVDHLVKAQIVHKESDSINIP